MESYEITWNSSTLPPPQLFGEADQAQVFLPMPWLSHIPMWVLQGMALQYFKNGAGATWLEACLLPALLIGERSIIDKSLPE